MWYLSRLGNIYRLEQKYLTITDAGWSSIEVDREGLGITDLEKRIEKLEEGFRKIEVKVERYTI